MSRELSDFEKIGGTYTEVDGIFYPNIIVEKEEPLIIGKYGLLWLGYMEENHNDRYRHLMRMGCLQRKAYEVNEEAYEMLEQIMNKYLAKHKPVNSNSTMEMWKIRGRQRALPRRKFMRQSFSDVTKNNANVGLRVGEREDFMTEKIREYNAPNGSMIIGIDNGYGNMKSARRCFPTAVTKYDSEPVLSRDYIEYEGSYYVIGEGHKGFVADKQSDDDNYVLTLVAIVKELKARGMNQRINSARIHLAVGLPLKWVQSQRNSFKEYLLRNKSVDVRYKNRLYQLEITGCTVMPQCYSAVAENLKCFKGITLLADIGNGTMNLMYLNNGRPMESKSWTEKLGVFQCFQRIHNEVQNNTGDSLMDDVVENILRSGEIDLPDTHAKYVRVAIESYVEDIFQKMRDHEYNENLMKVYFMGGGAGIVERYGKYNPDTTTFDHDIRANAKGYEYYCYMILKSQNRR